MSVVGYGVVVKMVSIRCILTEEDIIDALTPDEGC